MDSESNVALWSVAIALAWCGENEEAILAIDQLAARAPGWVYTHHALFLKHALRGEKELALGYDRPDLALEAKHDLHFALHVAHCYALVGEIDNALAYLEISVRSGMINHPFLSRHDPLLANLRKEERFQALMQEALAETMKLIV